MAGWLLVLGTAVLALVSGAANSLTNKVLYDTDCAAACEPALPGFQKPIYATLIAFAGMATSLLIWAAQAAQRWRSGRRRPGDLSMTGGGATPSVNGSGGAGRPLVGPVIAASGSSEGGVSAGDGQSPLLAPPRQAAGRQRHIVLRGLLYHAPLWVPALLDLLATAFQAAAVLYISAAVNATMRGTLLLFTALCNKWLKVRDARASCGEWAGIWLSTAAVALVGASAVLQDGGAAAAVGATVPSAAGNATYGGDPPPLLGSGGATPSGANMAALGISLSLLSNVVQAVQLVVETKYLELNAYGVAEINGMEGVMGVAVCVVLLGVLQAVPYGGDGGHIEDSAGTLCCLRDTPPLRYVSAALWAFFAVSTAAHMALSLLRGSNFRGFILVARALLVWAAELALAAAAPASGYGQPWQGWSGLEAAGFALLVLGGGVQWHAQTRREKEAAEGRDTEPGADNAALSSEAGRAAPARAGGIYMRSPPEGVVDAGVG
jgi:hypothetical protein